MMMKVAITAAAAVDVSLLITALAVSLMLHA